MELQKLLSSLAAQLVFDWREQIKQHRNQSLSSTWNGLLFLFTKYPYSECTDPRDKAFRIMSLSADCCSVAIPVDDSISAYKLYGQMLHDQFNHHQSKSGPTGEFLVIHASQLAREILEDVSESVHLVFCSALRDDITLIEARGVSQGSVTFKQCLSPLFRFISKRGY
jgi:hypothetical protein